MLYINCYSISSQIQELTNKSEIKISRNISHAKIYEYTVLLGELYECSDDCRDILGYFSLVTKCNLFALIYTVFSSFRFRITYCSGNSICKEASMV